MSLAAVIPVERIARDNGVECVRLFGVPFTNVSFEELCSIIDGQIAARVPGYMVTPNVDHVCRCAKSERFRNAYENAFASVADGTVLIWMSRLFGKRLKQKLSGSDLIPWLSEYAARKGYRVFYFGAAEGIAAEAANALQAQYSGLTVAGTYSPPLGFEKNPADTEKAAQAIRDARPDVCFVALGSPKQEFWMLDNIERTGCPVMVGIGAGLDFVAGRVRRAPTWAQRWGVEWLWRLLQEPRRLWRRYLVEDSYFLVLLFRELGRSIAGRN